MRFIEIGKCIINLEHIISIQYNTVIITDNRTFIVTDEERQQIKNVIRENGRLIPIGNPDNFLGGSNGR